MPDYLGGLAPDADSFAAYLQEGHDDGSYPKYYDKFLSPLDAAVLTLHLNGGEGSMEHRNYGEVWVTYHWTDDEAGIQMVQPFREAKSY